MWKSTGPCFTVGTLVYTPNGLKLIENLKVGELVYSYDLESKQLVTDVIEETYENDQANLYKLTLDDGSIIRGTYYHPFYNWEEGNWKPLGGFDPGSTLLTIDGNTRTSSKLEALGGSMHRLQ